MAAPVLGGARCRSGKWCASGRSRTSHSSVSRPALSSTGLPPSSRAVTPCRHSTYRIGVSFSPRSQGDERLTAEGDEGCDTPFSRVPPEPIRHAVWLCHRFCVSVQKTDDLLAPRGITTHCGATRPHTVRSCPRCRIARGSTTTPEPRCRTSRRDTTSDRCAGCPSVAQAPRLFTVPGLVLHLLRVGCATYGELSTIACSQRARAASGTR